MRKVCGMSVINVLRAVLNIGETFHDTPIKSHLRAVCYISFVARVFTVNQWPNYFAAIVGK